MQRASRLSAVAALAAAPCCEGLQGLRGASSLSTAAGEWSERASVEASDRRFWSSQLGGLELDLQRLLAESAPTTESATTESAPTTESATTDGVKKDTAKDPARKKDGKADGKAARHDDATAPPSFNINPKAAADLAPALAMLKGLYEDGKERVGKLNVREEESKARFAEKQKEHEARMNTIDQRFKNHKLSEEFHTNETRDENRLFSYWSRVRERQHAQYRIALKIQHGTLKKEKTMIDLYEQTMSGKGDRKAIAEKLARVSGHAPPGTLVLAQQQQSVQSQVADFCRDSLSELRTAQSLTAPVAAALH